MLQWTAPCAITQPGAAVAYEALGRTTAAPRLCHPRCAQRGRSLIVLRLGLIGDTGLEGLIAARDALQDDAWFSIVQFELALRSP